MIQPTPIRIRHELLALACQGMWQNAIAGREGLTHATVNHMLQRHAANGTLVPSKSTRAPRKTTPRQDCALLRLVQEDHFIRAQASICMDEEFVWNGSWPENPQQPAFVPWLPCL